LKNVILLTIDTLRKDVLGCYGNKDGLTPFIDSLQDKCIKFTNAQSTGPYTQASFPGILTSSYYLEYGRQKKCSPKRTLISEVLKKSGITTTAFHSNPYLSGYFGWNRGWDIFYDSMQDAVSDKIPYIKGEGINYKVDEWLSSYNKTGEHKPFFLWTHYMDVHEPYIPTRKYIDMVDSSIKLTEDEMYDLFTNIVLKRKIVDKKTIKLLRTLYDAGVRETDDYVKEFFAILDKNHLLEDSVIIITADHGDEFGEHGGLSHDGKMYSELIDIPLMIYNYSKNKNEVCDTLVSNIDIPPTIIYLFSLNPLKSFEGQSLLPLDDYIFKGIFGEAIGKHGNQEKENDKPIYFYREENFKIIYQEGERGEDVWEVYNLVDDPRETNNIVDILPQVEVMKNKLKPRIKRWEKKED